MDAATVFTAITSSLAWSAATAAWLSRTLVSHRLQKDLEELKSNLDRERASARAVVEGHPDVNWKYQVQHVFFDNLGQCANLMIVEETEGHERALRFHEFDSLLNGKDGTAALSPFPTILAGMTPQAKPLFWTRLVA